MKQLTLAPPVPMRQAVARECTRIIADAERKAAALRAAGFAQRADDLLADRQHLVDTITRGSEHTAARTRQR